MKTSLLRGAVVIVVTATASSAASPTRASVSTANQLQEQLLVPVVPLRVQRLLKRRAPQAAYVPTHLPPGYRYFSHENLTRTGFDLYFSCCTDNRPLLGFDAVFVKRSEPCNQGAAVKAFRIDGVVVQWNTGHNDQEAWHCIRRGGTRLLLTVSGVARPSQSTSWRTPRQLARMVASAQLIK